MSVKTATKPKTFLLSQPAIHKIEDLRSRIGVEGRVISNSAVIEVAIAELHDRLKNADYQELKELFLL